jgi:archaellum component FlaC
MMEEKKRINIQPLPQKAMKIINKDIKEEFPALRKKRYEFVPSEKQKDSLKKAIEVRKKKAGERKEKKDLIEKSVKMLMNRTDWTGWKQEANTPAENDVNSSVQQIYLSELDSLKGQIEAIKREKDQMESLLMELRDVIIENRRDLKSGEAKRIKYPEQAGNMSFVSGRLWGV